jgi:hypothetical protein
MKNEIINRKTKTVEDFEIYLYILTYSYFVARGIEQVDLAPTDIIPFCIDKVEPRKIYSASCFSYW